MDLRIDRIDMAFHLAVVQKWFEGRQAHGPIFEGDALAHMFDEQLDSWNYISVAEQDGRITEPEARQLRLMVAELAHQVKRLHKRGRPNYGGGDGGE